MSRIVSVLVLAATMVVVAPTAHAAFTTADCLAQKQKAWGELRKCEAGKKAKLLHGKPADLAKCQTKLADKLAKLNEQATDAAIACRYRDNGDGTVSDYDTGLQWERKTDDGSVHDKDNVYTWSLISGDTGFRLPDGTAFNVFLGTLNHGTSGDEIATSECFAGHCDWRLPVIEELVGIADCSQGNCIDQTVFGPTVGCYWSASSYGNYPTDAWWVGFLSGEFAYASGQLKTQICYVRAVRSDL